jgi:hypothetical protein
MFRPSWVFPSWTKPFSQPGAESFGVRRVEGETHQLQSVGMIYYRLDRSCSCFGCSCVQCTRGQHTKSENQEHRSSNALSALFPE